MAEVHDNLESSKTLDVCLRFGGGNELLSSRGLGSGDGVAEVEGHALTGGCNECDQLAECAKRLGRQDGGRSADSSAAATSALAD
jgi:hypothetical protein